MTLAPLTFTPLCRTSDIPNGQHRAFEVGGTPILVINLNHTFHAVRNRCTHLDYPLEGGRQIGCELICRKHGARFDVRDGRALGGPAVNPLPVFEVRIVEGWVETRVPMSPDGPSAPFALTPPRTAP